MAAEYIKSDIDRINDIVNTMKIIVDEDYQTYLAVYNNMMNLAEIYEGDAAQILVDTCINPMQKIGVEYVHIADELFKATKDKAKDFYLVEKEAEGNIMNI